jgi:hypothetical protein
MSTKIKPFYDSKNGLVLLQKSFITVRGHTGREVELQFFFKKNYLKIYYNNIYFILKIYF